MFKLVYLCKPFGKLLFIMLGGLLMTCLAKARLRCNNNSKINVERNGIYFGVFFELDMYYFFLCI